jgi:tRNA nucleotidyltransferase (CCA-adding enzyme)
MLMAPIHAALAAHLPPARLERLSQIRAVAAQLALPTYLAGGFVRDLLLGRVPGDFDLVVEPAGAPSASAAGPRLARALSSAFGGEVTVHAAFGTATWYDPLGTPVDCATTRTETYAEPAALPSVALAGSILDDLGRRDFSINAMAIRLDGQRLGEVLDPYHGAVDLQSGLVRVLHPASFVDDPTRLYRAVRYAQRLGFEIAGDTLELIPSALIAVEGLSGERLRHEFELVFREPRALEILARLEGLGLLRAAHPSLRWSSAETRRAAALLALPAVRWRLDPTPAAQAGFWALLLDAAAPSQCGRALDRLGVPRSLATAVTAALVLRVSGWPAQPRPSEIVAQLDRLPEAAVAAAYALNEAVRPFLDRYLAEWRFVRPELTGDDLQAMGLTPGPDFKQLLWQVRAARLDGEVVDRAEEAALVRRLQESG